MGPAFYTDCAANAICWHLISSAEGSYTLLSNENVMVIPGIITSIVTARNIFLFHSIYVEGYGP